MGTEKFSYSFRAPTEEERREIESIRRQYGGAEVQGIDRLRKLNAKVKNPAVCLGLTVGILGLLLFGLGLAIILEWESYFFGIAVAIVGVVPMLFANFVYQRVLRWGKKKYGEEILALSQQLLNE